MKEKIIKKILGMVAFIAPIFLFFMLSHMFIQAWPALKEIGFGLLDSNGKWQPLFGSPSYSLLPALLGTIYVSVLAVLFAIPFGLGCALFLHFYANKKIARITLVLIDLLAGIPSVVFGFLGLILLVKWFEQNFEMNSGECVLAAAALLAIMLLPYVVSNCSESIQKASKKWMPTVSALGLSKEYAICKIILPGIRSGIVSSIVLATGRALGETMAVMMVVGNSPIFPELFGRAQTIAGLTAMEIGSAENGSLHMASIYAANLLLTFLLLTLGVVYLVRKRMRKSI